MHFELVLNTTRMTPTTYSIAFLLPFLMFFFICQQANVYYCVVFLLQREKPLLCSDIRTECASFKSKRNTYEGDVFKHFICMARAHSVNIAQPQFDIRRVYSWNRAEYGTRSYCLYSSHWQFARWHIRETNAQYFFCRSLFITTHDREEEKNDDRSTEMKYWEKIEWRIYGTWYRAIISGVIDTSASFSAKQLIYSVCAVWNCWN